MVGEVQVSKWKQKENGKIKCSQATILYTGGDIPLRVWLGLGPSLNIASIIPTVVRSLLNLCEVESVSRMTGNED